MTNEESICHRTFSVMVDDVETLSLVRERRELEERCKSIFTSLILNAEERLNGLKIIKKDQMLLLAKVSSYTCKIAECVGWKKLWDHHLTTRHLCIQGYEIFGENDYLPCSCYIHPSAHCAMYLSWSVTPCQTFLLLSTQKQKIPGTLMECLITIASSFYKCLCFLKILFLIHTLLLLPH